MFIVRALGLFTGTRFTCRSIGQVQQVYCTGTVDLLYWYCRFIQTLGLLCRHCRRLGGVVEAVYRYCIDTGTVESV